MNKRVWRVVGLVVLAGFALIYVGVAILTKFGISYFIDPKLQEMTSMVATHQEKFLADLRLLDAKPIFADSSRSNDAQPVISQHIGWLSEDSSSDSNQKDLLLLSTEYSGFKKETLLKLAADPRVSNIDVSWVDQLETYDHWNLASSSIIKSKLEKAKVLNGIGRIGIMASLPMPNFELIRFASVVRFLQLEKKGEAVKGLRLMRHVSNLAHTTHTLVGAMIAVAALNVEHTIAETFGVKEWDLVEKDRVTAYKRVAWAWGAVMYQTMFNQFPAEFEAFLKPRNGLCTSVYEGSMSLGFRDFLEPTLPLEPDYSEALSRHIDLSRKLFALCSMAEYEFLLEPLPNDANPIFIAAANGDESVTGGIFGVNQARVPFVRRAFGLTFLTVATPSYFRQYEDLAATTTDQK